DALTSRDLRVEPKLGGDARDHRELLGADLAARDARHDRVGAVALHVGKRPVVGVLQTAEIAVEDVTAALAREDGCDGRLADVAAASSAEARDGLVPRGDAERADELEQLLPAVPEVLAESVRHGEAGLRELLLEGLLDERHTRAALLTGARAGLELRHGV